LPAGIPEAMAGAILTVDLGAIRENYRRLKARLGAAACGAVVKADAYGLGAAIVAPALAAEGCDSFFVAHLSEGIALRAVLAEPKIFVLNGLPPGAEDACVANGLTPVLNSAAQLAAWRALAERRGQRLAAAVQVDSGMSRLGMAPYEVEAVADDPAAFAGIDVVLVMSHLACADEPADPANEAQRIAFEAMAAKLPAAPRSLANASGVFLGSACHYDLARPGAALYGVNPTPDRPNPMRPVVGLAAKVIQLRDLEAGAGVGYGHALRTKAPMRAATIALGYADGWHRSNAGAAWFGGVRLPFAGRVSMDSIILDVSALPPGALREGDLVELIGERQDVDAVARLGGTIGYEVLTSLGRRFHRRYVGI
jgi:alanine racemase